jgi:hypothetical protein
MATSLSVLSASVADARARFEASSSGTLRLNIRQ